MRANYSVTKQPAAIAKLTVDLNSWLTSIGASLDSYGIGTVAGLGVALDDTENAVEVTFTSGVAGTQYLLELDVVASDGSTKAVTIEVIVPGVSPAPAPGPSAPTPSPGSPSPSPSPAPAEGVTWGDIQGDISAQADLVNILASKVSAGALSTKADATAVQNALDQKANAAAMAQALAQKADASALGGLATQQQLTAGLAAKVSATDLANAVANKADASALASKADAAATTTALASKANTADVNTALSSKANASDLAAKANATDLAQKADAAHTHDITTLTNFQTAINALVDARLQLYGLATAAPAPTPASPAPAPTTGAGTGVTETAAPVFDETKPMGIIDNGDGSFTVVVLGRGWPSSGNNAVDYYKIQPRMNGVPVANTVGQFYVDQATGLIMAATTYGAFTGDIGGRLSFLVTAYNEAAPNGVTVATTSVLVTKASNTGMAGGASTGTSSGGVGTLALVSLVAANDFTIPANARSFAVMPTLAGTVLKAGGESLIVSDVGNVYDDSSVGTTAATTWSGGTPVAAGTTATAVNSNWNELGAGRKFTAQADTTERTFYLNLGLYSGTLTVACALSDGSSAAKSFDIPSEPTLANNAAALADTGVNRLIAIKFKAGSAGQTATFTATMTQILSGPVDGGGNAHFGSAYVV